LPISDENVEKLARVLKVPADWLAEQWLRTALTRHQHLLRDRISK